MREITAQDYEVISMEWEAAAMKAHWAVVYGLVPFIVPFGQAYSGQWCVRSGIQGGVEAYGNTPIEAINNFDKAMASS